MQWIKTIKLQLIKVAIYLPSKTAKLKNNSKQKSPPISYRQAWLLRNARIK